MSKLTERETNLLALIFVLDNVNELLSSLNVILAVEIPEALIVDPKVDSPLTTNDSKVPKVVKLELTTEGPNPVSDKTAFLFIRYD